MTPGEAANLIDRATDAAYDTDALRLYTAITGLTVSAVPEEWLGTLHDRLSLFATPETVQAIGSALVDMLPDAIDYVRRAWRRVENGRRADLEAVTLSCGVTMRSDYAEAWAEQCRPRAHRKPRPSAAATVCAVPPPERGAQDHRQSRRILKEYDRNGVAMYQALTGKAPQVDAEDERDWDRDFAKRMRRSRALSRSVQPRRTTGSPPGRLAVIDVGPSEGTLAPLATEREAEFQPA